MKIECILRRDPPATVILGETAYQFQVDGDGRHVCEVDDPMHLARLLSISEAYCLPGQAPVPDALKPAIEEHALPAEVPVLAPVDENVIKGSTVHPATFDLGNDAVTDLEDVVAHALELSGLTTYEWNHLPDEERHNLIDVALDTLDQREPVAEVAEVADAPVPEAKPTPETAPVSDAGSSNGAAPSDAPGATGDDLEGLRAAYLEKFGKPAVRKLSATKLRALLATKE